MVGIAHKGMAFPISWTVLPKEGSSSAEEQCKALERFFAVVDPSDIEVVLADREFISAEWLRWLQGHEVPFVVRLRSDRRIGLASQDSLRGEPALPVRMFARPLQVGQGRVLGGTHYLRTHYLRTHYLHRTGGEYVKAYVKAKVVIRRIAPSASETGDAFLVLATWAVDPERATTFYKERWGIETMFAALKSRGYRLEETHLTAPGRVERLMGLLALAFAWTHVIGERRATREGPPRTKSHGRRQRSLFRYGLDLLRGILTTPEPQPAAFFDCLRGLRSPTAFLSCT
jgi:hypothetical protein